MEKEGYEAQIKALKEEIELLKKKQTYEIKRQKYGLNWIDVPEAFEKDSENKIPVLEEVKEKSIKNNDGKPTHILIEGDNYHALQCLNYTHKGKIDVIYIDPPYNTGSDGFRYKDARFLDEYPDGTEIPKEHPLRHSVWISYIQKRLKIAEKLLSQNGVIFISIDDNELCNLLLLCNSIFTETNLMAIFPRLTTKSGKTPLSFMISHDYVICYTKQNKNIFIGDSYKDDSYKYSDEYVNERGFYNLKQPLDCNSISYSKSLDYPIEHDGKVYYPGGSKKLYEERKTGKFQQKDYAWRWSKELYEFGLKNGWIVFSKNGRIYTKGYLNARIEKEGNEYKIIYEEKTRKKSTIDFIQNDYSNDIAKKQLLALNLESKFDFPKPINLLSELIKSHFDKSATILDFFAGSGTTLHATMKLNEEDGGNRQCILVQLNENNICEEVTYERNRRVMQGYTNSKGEQIPGLGNSLKYYKTAFIGKNNCKNANDDDRTELAKKAGCLLSLGENTLDEICSTEYYQLFTGSKEATAVYFTDDYEKFDEFKEKVAELAPKFKKTFVYIFAWSSADDFAYEFEDIPNIQIKAIPLPILEIYKSIYN